MPKEQREALHNYLMTEAADKGAFGSAPGNTAACMTHVPFKRRFGGGKAECLK